jgi:nucleotide-binding universal stress UspA family protein
MGIFDRVVVGIDGSEFGFEALYQALALRSPDGILRAVTALDEGKASLAGFRAPAAAESLAQEAQDAHAAAEKLLAAEPGCEALLVKGDPIAALLGVAHNAEATLLAVGSRHRSRTAGLLLSGVGTVVLHDAPCSVLFAHPQWGRRWSPRRIIVGVDGSDLSLAALRAADDLAERLASGVRVVSATGTGVERAGDPWAERVDDWATGPAVVALVDASVFADLVIVGSRGAHGIRALGSVGERVAHRAHSSVLVVRASKGSDGDIGPAPGS